MSIQHKPCNIEAWLDALGAPSADRDYQPGHERVFSLIQAIQIQGCTFHKPKLRIRIAGTNGKGSTANFLAKALQANGYNVGLYTSPHIISFHERIQVSGEPISQRSLLALMEVVMPLALEVGASYFETATVLGLLYFSQQQVDVEVLEAGVGAKLDATTAIGADVGLLTSVGLDHQEWLGDTLEAIAQDKAYVFQGCDIQMTAPQPPSVRQVIQGMYPNIQYSNIFPKPLQAQGDFQPMNAGLAFAALQSIESTLLSLDLGKASDAIAQTVIAGRLQYILHDAHQFWLDAAHNAHAIHNLLPSLAEKAKFDVIFLSTREDRDLSACVPELSQFTNKMVVMTGKDKHAYADITQALSTETPQYQQGIFLVLGSFVTLGATLKWMQQGL